MEGLIYTGSNQRVPEYHAWTCLCVGMGIRTYVELGCGSSHEQHEAGIRVVTVDILPNGLGDGLGGFLPHVQGDSHDPATLQRVLDTLGEPPDCVFIDADHSYAATKADFDLWWPLVRRMVGFHDIRMPGTMDFWREVSRLHPSIELVSRDTASACAWQHGATTGDVDCGGIGVLFK